MCCCYCCWCGRCEKDEGRKMAKSLACSKGLLAFFNFLLLACGCTLITGGLILLLDPEKVLLSKLMASGALSTLTHPFLYYLAIATAALGLYLAATGILGCWASCLHNFCILTFYFLAVIIILIGECAIYVLATIWPTCLGLGLDPEDLVKSLQRNYGVTGQEQFTAAVDLAQANFQCCGIETANEYDTSLWVLQSLGPPLVVPLSCCKLTNFNESKAYLNPQPINATLCQALEKNRHEVYRHTLGCRDYLEDWYTQHYILFLGVGLVLVLIEFAVLLSTIFTCVRVYKYKKSMKAADAIEVSEDPRNKRTITVERTYRRGAPLAYTNDAYVLTNSFRQNYKIPSSKA